MHAYVSNTYYLYECIILFIIVLEKILILNTFKFLLFFPNFCINFFIFKNAFLFISDDLLYLNLSEYFIFIYNMVHIAL